MGERERRGGKMKREIAMALHECVCVDAEGGREGGLGGGWFWCGEGTEIIDIIIYRETRNGVRERSIWKTDVAYFSS